MVCRRETSFVSALLFIYEDDLEMEIFYFFLYCFSTSSSFLQFYVCKVTCLSYSEKLIKLNLHIFTNNLQSEHNCSSDGCYADNEQTRKNEPEQNRDVTDKLSQKQLQSKGARLITDNCCE